jgi:release factor glutamine methyltransferase
MKLSELRRQGKQILEQAGFENPLYECDYLLSGSLDLPLLELQLDGYREISSSLCEKCLLLLERRARHEPAQYLLGRAPFRELELKVTPAVLIPRPETEELVDLALELAPLDGKVLDMGTGSGAIPLALKSERPDLQMTGADLSLEALAIARENSQKLNLAVEFLHSDLWSALENRCFDLVTANLPYVSEAEYKMCEQEIFYEPVMALTAPDEGLFLMKKMISELDSHLSPGGGAVFELSDGQNDLICAYGESCNFKAEMKRDLAGKKRFVILRKR